jgi:hypothetical protein
MPSLYLGLKLLAWSLSCLIKKVLEETNIWFKAATKINGLAMSTFLNLGLQNRADWV